MFPGRSRSHDLPTSLFHPVTLSFLISNIINCRFQWPRGLSLYRRQFLFAMNRGPHLLVQWIAVNEYCVFACMYVCMYECMYTVYIYIYINRGKGEVHRRTGHEGPEGEWSYIATLSFTLALDGVGGQRHAPAALPPGTTQYPLYKRLGWRQSWFGQVRKISRPLGVDPRTFQPVARRYID
jgi:hypothetical protein